MRQAWWLGQATAVALFILACFVAVIAVVSTRHVVRVTPLPDGRCQVTDTTYIVLGLIPIRSGDGIGLCPEPNQEDPHDDR